MTTHTELDKSALIDPQTWRAGVPHTLFDALREQEPISWNEPETGGYWSLTRHKDIAQVSKDHERFTVERGDLYPRPNAETLAVQRDMLTLIDPPNHTRLRKLAAKSFTPRVIAKLEEWVREVIRGVLTDVSDKSEFDFMHDVAARIPGLVIASMLGIGDENGRETIVSCATDVFAMDQPDGQERHVRGLQNLAAFLFQVREDKRAHPGDDIMSALNEARDDNGQALTDMEYVKFVSLLTLAGFETTHTLMGQGMRILLEEPRINDVVREAVENDATRDAVEELLRVVCPVNYFARTAKEDVQIGDQVIKEGEMVLQWFAAANRDPEVFLNPHEFDLNRTPNPHMAFGGGGVHHCLGNHIARLETKILLEEMYSRQMKLEIAGEPRRGANIFVNQILSLPVRHV